MYIACSSLCLKVNHLRLLVSVDIISSDYERTEAVPLSWSVYVEREEILNMRINLRKENIFTDLSPASITHCETTRLSTIDRSVLAD